MVIDTSAILAILFHEEDALELARAIETASVRRVSAATLLEAAIVIETRYGEAGGEKLDQFLAAARVQIEPVTEEQSETAVQDFVLTARAVIRQGLISGTVSPML